MSFICYTSDQWIIAMSLICYTSDQCIIIIYELYMFFVAKHKTICWRLISVLQLIWLGFLLQIINRIRSTRDGITLTGQRKYFFLFCLLKMLIFLRYLPYTHFKGLVYKDWSSCKYILSFVVYLLYKVLSLFLFLKSWSSVVLLVFLLHLR